MIEVTLAGKTDPHKTIFAYLIRSYSILAFEASRRSRIPEDVKNSLFFVVFS